MSKIFKLFALVAMTTCVAALSRDITADLPEMIAGNDSCSEDHLGFVQMRAHELTHHPDHSSKMAKEAKHECNGDGLWVMSSGAEGDQEDEEWQPVTSLTKKNDDVFQGIVNLKSERYKLLWCDSSNHSFLGARLGSLAAEDDMCFRCGLSGQLTEDDEEDIPGPEIAGIYKMTVKYNKELSTLEFDYKCASQCSPQEAKDGAPQSRTQSLKENMWDGPLRQELFLYGSGVVQGASKDRAQAITRIRDSSAYVGTMALTKGGFRLIQSKQSKRKGVGMKIGSEVKASGSSEHAFSGFLALDTMFDEAIPGPSVEGTYKITVELESEMIEYVCQAGPCKSTDVTWDGTLHEKQGLELSNKLYIVGNATEIGWQRRQAVKLVKDAKDDTFRGTLRLQPGSFKFVTSREHSGASVGLDSEADLRIEPEGCFKCGIRGLLAMSAGQLVDDSIPGPGVPGLYAVTANLADGTVSYVCVEQCDDEGDTTSNAVDTLDSEENAMWDGSLSEKLFILGGATKAGWNLADAIELTKDSGANIFRGTVYLRNGRGGFKFVRSTTSWKDDLGTAIGSWARHSGSCNGFKCGLSGRLQEQQRFNGQIVKMDVPGPRVAGVFDLVANLDTGKVTYKCAEQCEKPWVPSAEHHAPNHASDTFVHLFEWSWLDIATECEQWLGPKGFTAVQVSPPNEHDPRNAWWARYQPVSYNISSRSGDEAAFVSMVQRCKAVGVSIYVDAVINHMASGTGVGSQGSAYSSNTLTYPTYSASDFHRLGPDTTKNCQIEDYHNKREVQDCGLLGLPDLCTECGHVQDTIAAYFAHLEKLGVDGIRVDAAKHMNATALSEILKRTPKYRFMEVIGSEESATPPSEYFYTGQVTEFAYTQSIKQLFLLPGQLDKLASFGEDSGMIPRESAVVFINNHDTQRSNPGLTYRQRSVFALASIFMLAHPYGYPKIMSSYDFEDGDFDAPPPSVSVHGPKGALRCGKGEPWVCEHRWPSLANMVQWRRSAKVDKMDFFNAVDGDRVYFCRGKAACLALNRDETNSWSTTLNLTLPAGEYCNVVKPGHDDVGCTVVTVDKDGLASVSVPPLGAVAVHTGAMAGSGWNFF